jgi:hypothetical protein
MTYQVVLIERRNAVRAVTFAVRRWLGEKFEPMSVRSRIGISSSIIALEAFVYVKAQEENRIGSSRFHFKCDHWKITSLLRNFASVRMARVTN